MLLFYICLVSIRNTPFFINIGSSKCYWNIFKPLFKIHSGKMMEKNCIVLIICNRMLQFKRCKTFPKIGARIWLSNIAYGAIKKIIIAITIKKAQEKLHYLFCYCIIILQSWAIRKIHKFFLSSSDLKQYNRRNFSSSFRDDVSFSRG